MSDAYRATRQFERTVGPGVFKEGYDSRQPVPLSKEDSQLVAIIFYNLRNGNVRVERKV